MKKITLSIIIILIILVLNAQQKKLTPKFYLTYNAINASKGQDARNGSNDEIIVKLYANNVKIDSYSDFGSGEYSEEEMSLFLSSDISEKTYKINVLNDSKITVSYVLILQGEEKENWIYTYVKDKNNKWNKIK
ncbi:MAG: hypothetical protein ACK452_17230 [Bacteroidota bacterium]